jgi:quinol monooxygenase YgiN
MVTAKALLVRLEAKADQDEEVKKFLLSALPLVGQEPGTVTWFAIKFGSYEYGIFDTFPDEAGRDAHLTGPVAKALMEKAPVLFAKPPEITKLDVLVQKLPPGHSTISITKALLLTFKAKEGHQEEVETFLSEAQAMAVKEEETIYWFGIALPGGDYGIFDVFPDNSGRMKHLTGKVPVELLKESLTILGSVPDMALIDVLTHKETNF